MEHTSPGFKNLIANPSSDDEIYIIDDNPDILGIIESILVDHKFKVKSFSKASELLIALEKKTPAMVLSDYNMPEMCGLRLLESIRANHESLPFIFISGNVSNEFKDQAGKLGVTGHIEKPFDPKDLAKQIASLIAQKTSK